MKKHSNISMDNFSHLLIHHHMLILSLVHLIYVHQVVWHLKIFLFVYRHYVVEQLKIDFDGYSPCMILKNRANSLKMFVFQWGGSISVHHCFFIRIFMLLFVLFIRYLEMSQVHVMILKPFENIQRLSFNELTNYIKDILQSKISCRFV